MARRGSGRVRRAGWLVAACVLLGTSACTTVYGPDEELEEEPPVEKDRPGEPSVYQENRAIEECMGESTDYLCTPL